MKVSLLLRRMVWARICPLCTSKAANSETVPLHLYSLGAQPLTGYLFLCVFPAASQSPGNKEERDSYSQQHQDLRPQMGKRLVTPKYFCEAVNCPGVDRQQACLLHRLWHQEPRKHASTYGRHDQDDQRRKRAKLCTC